VLDRLNDREKLFVIGGGAFLVLAAIYFGSQFLMTQRLGLSGGADQVRSDLSRLHRLKEDLALLPVAREIPDINNLKATVYNRLEKSGLQGDIRERTEKVSRKEEKLVIDLNMKGVSLKNLIDFIYDIEMSQSIPLSVGKMQLRRPLPEREIYDVNLSLTVSRPIKE